MGFNVSDIIGGSIGDAISKVAKVFKADPTVVEQNKFELAKIEAELKEKVLDAAAREVEAASANIRAEAESGDKYTSRARPTFMYMVIALLFWNYAIVPLFGKEPVNLPDALFYLFGFAVLGYTGARTFEKFAELKLGVK